MKFYLIADTHLKHDKMQTYCQRVPNFTEIIHRNIMNTLTPKDCLIHLGDVGIAKKEDWAWMIPLWPGKKTLIRGNHDRQISCSQWMDLGFDFACDGLKFRNMWLTHEPSTSLADGCELNIHGHLHNIWHGFTPEGKEDRADMWKARRLKNPWQRLFAVEYTHLMPIEFDKFISHPERYQSKGPTSNES